MTIIGKPIPPPSDGPFLGVCHPGAPPAPSPPEFVIDRVGTNGRTVVRFADDGSVELREQLLDEEWYDRDGITIESEAWGRLIALYNGKLQREATAREEAELRYQKRLDGLRARVNALGGSLGGQDETEGVIDGAGKWHDLDSDDPDALNCIEAKIAELEAAAGKAAP